MYFKSFEYLKDIEKQINESYSLPIFKGYKAINKRGVEKLIDEIYANLPIDVQEARKYLSERQIEFHIDPDKNVYDNLKKFEIEVEKSFQITKYVIMNVKKIENILNRIYASVPKEIMEAKENEKL